MIANIKTLKNFDDLEFFILTANATLVFSKIMIFVNSFDERMILVNLLHNLILIYMKNNRKKIIKTFTLVLKLDTKYKVRSISKLLARLFLEGRKCLV